jgi:hypothetical protein
MVTNEREIMPTFVDLFEVLVWCIKTLVDQYKRVFIPCVTGNHGRNTHKIRAKGRNFTNFDWLLYQTYGPALRERQPYSFLYPRWP